MDTEEVINDNVAVAAIPTSTCKWQSRFLRYIDTRPNGDALRKCILKGPYTPSVIILAVLAIDDSSEVPERTTVETILNMSPETKALYESEKEAIHLLLTKIGDEIYSTVDACKTTHEMWIAIERLQQGESLNIQDVKTNLFWEFGKFTSHDGVSMESYYSRFYNMMNEMIRNNLTVATMQVNVQFLQQLQPEWSRFVTIVKQQYNLDTVSYFKLFDILKQYQKEVNETQFESDAEDRFNEVFNTYPDPDEPEDGDIVPDKSTLTLAKRIKRCLKIDKLNLSKMEEHGKDGYEMFGNRYMSKAEYEYNMDQMTIAMSDDMDWALDHGLEIEIKDPLPLIGPKWLDGRHAEYTDYTWVTRSDAEDRFNEVVNTYPDPDEPEDGEIVPDKSTLTLAKRIKRCLKIDKLNLSKMEELKKDGYEMFGNRYMSKAEPRNSGNKDLKNRKYAYSVNKRHATEYKCGWIKEDIRKLWLIMTWMLCLESNIGRR
ncbi:hypothetical protein Tco_0083721 [Tanacetum coccineum]